MLIKKYVQSNRNQSCVIFLLTIRSVCPYLLCSICSIVLQTHIFLATVPLASIPTLCLPCRRCPRPNCANVSPLTVKQFVTFTPSLSLCLPVFSSFCPSQIIPTLPEQINYVLQQCYRIRGHRVLCSVRHGRRRTALPLATGLSHFGLELLLDLQHLGPTSKPEIHPPLPKLLYFPARFWLVNMLF